MSEPASIALVIPCYRERRRILSVLEAVDPCVRHILVVDDGCPDGTGEIVSAQCGDPRVEVLIHERNLGVGAATITGYRRALELGVDIIVKMDGDGQMDGAMIPTLVSPIARGRADYAKGNRFHDLRGLGQMPWSRILANLILSFMTKLSSGYWDLFDPTNGFTAIHADVVRQLPLDRISPRYFFESDILYRLYTARAVVIDVPMPARYGAEVSGIHPGRVLWEFPVRHVVNTGKRVAYTYFLRDFSVASVQLVLGILMVLFGVYYGGISWYASVHTGVPATAGTVVLAALPIILGSQFLLSFLDFDTRNVPREPLHTLL